MSQERLYTVLLGPHISEKSSVAAEQRNQIVFKVRKDASKLEIKRAVEHLFDVKVDAVQVANVKGKRKYFRQAPGQRNAWKKAYVCLKPGSDINFLPKT